MPAVVEGVEGDGMAGVFVNYRTGDGDWAATLIADRLSARFGKENVFYASRSIRLGEDFSKRILANVPKCDVLLAVIGSSWTTARDRENRRRIDDPEDWVRREIALALEHGVRVVPVLLDGLARIAENDLPQEIAALARCQYLRLHHRNDYHDMARMISELTELIPEQEPKSPLVITANTTCRQGESKWLIDGSIGQVPPPDELGWQEWRQWAQDRGSPVRPDNQLSLRVEAIDRQAVILERLRFLVTDHATAGGVVLTVPGRSVDRGPLLPRRLSIDLEPDTAGTGRPTSDNTTDFPYVVSQSEPEWFLVELNVGPRDVTWVAELDWSSASRSGTLRIDRGGEPFRTATLLGRPSYLWSPHATPPSWVSIIHSG